MSKSYYITKGPDGEKKHTSASRAIRYVSYQTTENSIYGTAEMERIYSGLELNFAGWTIQRFWK